MSFLLCVFCLDRERARDLFTLNLRCDVLTDVMKLLSNAYIDRSFFLPNFSKSCQVKDSETCDPDFPEDYSEDYNDDYPDYY